MTVKGACVLGGCVGDSHRVVLATNGPLPNLPRPWVHHRSGSAVAAPLFACPQQPSLLLPASRLRDGICDCCDGSDEPPPSRCPDICDRVLKKEREARAKAEAAYRAGSQRRLADLAAFRALREAKMRDLQELEKTAAAMSAEAETLQGRIREWKQSYVRQRMATMKDGVAGHPDMAALVRGLDRPELEQLVVHACQVAAEMAPATDKGDTCAALRVAGLDLALTWDEDDYDDVEGMKGQVEVSWELVQLLFENASNGGSLNWKVGARAGKNPRRRLDEVLDDEDYLGSYDEDSDVDYDGGMYGDDDFVYKPPSEGSENSSGVDQAEVGGKKKEFVDSVMASTFSRTRVSFLERSKDVLQKIAVVMDSEEDGPDVEEKKESATDDTVATFDPAAFTIVRNELRRREDSIRRGFSWAASAKLLFAFSNQSDENLQRLAVGTLYYGQLSAIQVWQILQAILPEYVALAGDTPNDTCASPWAGHCPARPISRRGADYPPPYLLTAANAFCEQQASSGDIQRACSGPAGEPDAIPTSVPDGYYGYTSPVKRSDVSGDPLSVLFAPIDGLAIDTDGLKALETKKGDLERSKKDTERSITDTWKDIGGKDGDEMGQDGELHGLAGKCHEILAGKYTYEVCLFGRATQKEGAGGSGGTSLGNWKGMDIDASTGQRVMRWTDGQKCWNGPKRSATVYLTCGAENKVISADEPDTCRYVFEMESYIACDEDYKARAGL